MFKNNIKIAWRNLIKTKLYSVLNIVGLATGMAAALLIGFWIKDELSFNRYHTNHERLAAIMSTVTFDGRATTYMAAPAPLAEELRDHYAGDFSRVALTSEQGHVMSAGDERVSSQGLWAQPEFPVMFTFRMLKGNQDALSDRSSLLD